MLSLLPGLYLTIPNSVPKIGHLSGASSNNLAKYSFDISNTGIFFFLAVRRNELYL
jgi:hypothetical protein